MPVTFEASGSGSLCYQVALEVGGQIPPAPLMFRKCPFSVTFRSTANGGVYTN